MIDALLDIIEKLELPEGEIPEPVAQFLLGISFSEAEKQRYLALADRHNNEGLSAEELQVLEAFVDADTLLSLLRSKATRTLANHQPAA
jgi:hypothetical protein